MITSWDSMQDIVYSDDYHCEHFAVDALKFLTGTDISAAMFTGVGALPINVKNFIKIPSPTQFSLILMRDKNKAHIGVWFDNAVLHLADTGVVYQPLAMATRGFSRISFYEVNHAII